MWLDLTDEEAAPLLRFLDRAIEDDRYFPSPRMRGLRTPGASCRAHHRNHRQPGRRRRGPFPGGETGLETRTRGLAALRGFVAKQPYRRVGVSTHGAMVRQMMKHALPPGTPPAKTSNTVLYILRYAPVDDRLAVLEAGAR
jgi:broad specificity phosphatase PhoE